MEAGIEGGEDQQWAAQIKKYLSIFRLLPSPAWPTFDKRNENADERYYV